MYARLLLHPERTRVLSLTPLLLLASVYFMFDVTARASHLPFKAPLAGNSGPCNPSWSVISSPNVATYNNQLFGVAAISASDIWAVGGDNDLGNASQTLVEHWDGSTWSVVSSPNVGIYGSTLDSVAAISASDIWAVGQYSNSTVSRTLIEHWDGNGWSVIPSPNLGTTPNLLYGVAAISANDAWAVGYGGGGSGTVNQTLVEHWDGSSWSIVPSPNNGTLQNGLYGVSAISANDVWAAGNYYNTTLGAHQTLIEHWDGNNWSIVASPNIGASDDYLNAVTAVSANDVWTVGFTLPQNFTDQTTLVEHWDGSAWTIVPSPNMPGAPNGLFGLSAASPSDVWAVGYDSPSNFYRTLVEHWDGSAWAIVPSPNAGTSYNFLNGMVAIAGDVWAVGIFSDPSNDRETLTERYEPCAGSPTAVVTQTATPPPTMTPALTSTSTAISTSTATPTNAPTQITRTSTPTEIPDPTDTVNPTGTATNAPSSTPAATGTGTSTATALPTSCSIIFSDVHATDYFHDAVTYLACHGAISGYSDGTFRPYNNTTRGQMTKIVVLGFGIPIDTSGGPHFLDVPATYPFYTYIETANHNGIVSGYSDGTFRPSSNVTRGQLSKIVVQAAVQMNGWALVNPPTPNFSDVPYGSAFYRYVETAVSKGLISGYSDHTFRPGNDATRGQIAKITYLAVASSAPAPQTFFAKRGGYFRE